MSRVNSFDLESRTIDFSSNVIQFCSSAPKNSVTNPIISQLIRSATSIGANYHEANGASSRKDFKNKLYICKKEAKETFYWLTLIINTKIIDSSDALILKQEVNELVLIFSSIINKT